MGRNAGFLICKNLNLIQPFKKLISTATDIECLSSTLTGPFILSFKRQFMPIFRSFKMHLSGYLGLFIIQKICVTPPSNSGVGLLNSIVACGRIKLSVNILN